MSKEEQIELLYYLRDGIGIELEGEEMNKWHKIVDFAINSISSKK